MMKQAVRLMLCVAIVAALASPAMAQTPPPTQAPPPTQDPAQATQTPPDEKAAKSSEWTDRVFVNVSLVFQIKANTNITTSSTSTVYAETATIDSAQVIESQAATFDIGGGFRVWRNLGVGIGYSQLSTTGAAAVSAKVPHPLLYDQPRTATASATGLQHSEKQVHIYALWMLPLAPKIDVAVFGGPTIFMLKQGVVGAVSFSEVGAPYTSVNLNYNTYEVSKGKTGFNVGADLTYKITKMFGVGGFFRYAGTTIEITPPGSAAVKVSVGGVQIGVGGRIRF
jgi:hypothetical protein